ncbi:hypothetical protein RJ639_028284, partial [Escallonia herrerae]
MGDLSTLAKARRELEDLYLGVPDDSVNLTFQDLAEVKQLHAHHSTSLERKRSGQLNPITEATTPKREKPLPPNLAKLPSLDFSRGLEASMRHHHQTNTHYHHDHHGEKGLHASRGSGGLHDHHHASGRDHHRDHHAVAYSPRRDVGFRHAIETSVAFDDVSGMSIASTVNPFQEKGGRRRPGIPHSNICTVCSVYIYMFRHRCLVCGRVYCKQCLSVGMGEMTEGRKCIECLGKRFSQRYIQRAGKVGCWTGGCMRYPSTVKQQELKWAEKGPRRSDENRYGRSVMVSRSGVVSRSRSPMTPRTPTRAHNASNPPSFVVNSPYSPYSPSSHHLP